MLKTIGIDIGHNLRSDVGACGIRSEDELNMLVGQALISKFKGIGIKVIECLPSSASSLRDGLSKRCRAANYGGADVFISIHHNSCKGGYGSECLCIKGGQQNALSERLSKVILEEIAMLGFSNRGVKDRRDIFVINNTTMPAVLVECAFVDSERDMKNYDTEKMATAIFKGICRFYGIEEWTSTQGNGSSTGELGGTSTSGGNQQSGTSNTGNQQGGTSSGSNSGNGSNIGCTSYTVQKGDTLWGISRKFGVSVDDIVRINGIKDKNKIYVGQKINF